MPNSAINVSFSAGQNIFRKGDPGNDMFAILSGRVEIRSGDVVLDSLESGEIFGEMALIDNNPRSADAFAVTDCELEEIGEQAFLFRVGEAPFFALKVMKTMAARLRTANENKK